MMGLTFYLDIEKDLVTLLCLIFHYFFSAHRTHFDLHTRVDAFENLEKNSIIIANKKCLFNMARLIFILLKTLRTKRMCFSCASIISALRMLTQRRIFG